MIIPLVCVKFSLFDCICDYKVRRVIILVTYTRTIRLTVHSGFTFNINCVSLFIALFGHSAYHLDLSVNDPP